MISYGMGIFNYNPLFYGNIALSIFFIDTPINIKAIKTSKLVMHKI